MISKVKRRFNKKKSGKYKSRLEEKMARQIARLSGERDTYERTSIQYKIPRRYVPDFTVGGMFIEVKGYFRPEDRTKMRCVKADNPEADIRMVFAADNKISSRSSMRYSDWCEKYGFPYAVGEVPREWFK